MQVHGYAYGRFESRHAKECCSLKIGLDGNESSGDSDDSHEGNLDALLHLLNSSGDVQHNTSNDDDDGDDNIMNQLSLRKLHDLIYELKLPYKIGDELTPGDGNCFFSRQYCKT